MECFGGYIFFFFFFFEMEGNIVVLTGQLMEV